MGRAVGVKLSIARDVEPKRLSVVWLISQCPCYGSFVPWLHYSDSTTGCNHRLRLQRATQGSARRGTLSSWRRAGHRDRANVRTPGPPAGFAQRWQPDKVRSDRGASQREVIFFIETLVSRMM
jgi:hypothetical protein